MQEISLSQAKAAKRRAQRRGQRDSSPYVDPDQQRIRPDTHADSIEDQYLSARDGVNLREEAATEKGRAKSWSDVIDAFEDYIWRQQKAADTWFDEKGVRPSSHRFTEEAAKDRHGRTLGVDRAARKLWGEDVTTVHVVRRARAFGENGQPQPPADHLADLLDGNSAVYAAYQRHIADHHGLTYARLSVLEPHSNGYAHLHDALWVHDPEGVVGETDIYPAVDAHVRAVDQARPRYHGPDAVEVRHNPARREYDGDPDGVPLATALPREMTKYLGGFGPDDGERSNPSVPNVLQSDRGPMRFFALLWATGIRQWRPDQSVFPHLVNASQGWWGEDGEDDDETYAVPEDIDNSGGGPEKVTINSRPVAFEPLEADAP
ncbi:MULTISPECIES: hypothetical protein [Salinibaculum]|uniref:hypothetical protein n=1 Tax=Salinibaculum TaxID=2732368 RepID=UPI0030CD93DA